MRIVKNSNSHIYREDDKMELKSQVNKMFTVGGK